LVYQANHCSACHAVNGVGMKLGPPLNGLAQRRSRSWVEEHFAKPQELSPGSIMPPYKLTPRDLENLTTYLLALPERGGSQ
jgi:mono/diheme cytochrome c family protein